MFRPQIPEFKESHHKSFSKRLKKRNRFRFLSFTLWMQFKQFYENKKSLKVSKVEPIHSAT